MKLTDMKENFVFYTEITLDGGGSFVKLREPSIGELDSLNSASDNERITELAKLFPACLVDHSFEDDGGGKAGAKEVYAELKSSGTLFMEIIVKWMESLPFKSRLGSKGT
jgi:hypothetical protein